MSSRRPFAVLDQIRALVYNASSFFGFTSTAIVDSLATLNDSRKNALGEVARVYENPGQTNQLRFASSSVADLKGMDIEVLKTRVLRPADVSKIHQANNLASIGNPGTVYKRMFNLSPVGDSVMLIDVVEQIVHRGPVVLNCGYVLLEDKEIIGSVSDVMRRIGTLRSLEFPVVVSTIWKDAYPRLKLEPVSFGLTQVHDDELRQRGVNIVGITDEIAVDDTVVLGSFPIASEKVLTFVERFKVASMPVLKFYVK